MDVPEEEPEEEWEEEEEDWEEEREEEWEEEEEEQEEEIRRGLSNKRYVCSCFIEDTSLTFTDYLFTVYRWMKDGGWGRGQLRMKTSTGTFMWKKDEYEPNLHPQLNVYKR